MDNQSFGMQTNKPYKVVLLGNSGTGKTSIIDFMVLNAPQTQTQPTIVFQGHTLTIDTGQELVPLMVWDTAGQEAFRSLVPIYVRDSDAALLVFDVTDAQSFQALEKWYSLLLEEAGDSVLIYIVCNKIDLTNVVVGEPEISKMCARLHAKSARVCAIDGRGLKELFLNVATDVASSNNRRELRTLDIESDRQGGCC